MLFGMILFGSCAKESTVLPEDVKDKMSLDDKRYVQKILDFTAAMSGDTELRTKEAKEDYTPEEFLKNTEESFNYSYSIPFDKYLRTWTMIDTLLIPNNNCNVKGDKAPAYFKILQKKLSNHYYSLKLDSKKMKLVKLDLIDKDCKNLKVSLTTIVGTKDKADAENVNENYVSNRTGNTRMTFNSELWAEYGTCTNPGGTLSTASILADKATYNIIGGYEAVHTVINIQEIYAHHENMGWWSFTCRVEGADPEHSACSDYLNSNGSYTQLGYDHFCLTATELNDYLLSTEQNCSSIANANNKDFVNLSAHVDYLGVLGFIKVRWIGTLTIGNKIYRENDPILPPGE